MEVSSATNSSFILPLSDEISYLTTWLIVMFLTSLTGGVLFVILLNAVLSQQILKSGIGILIANLLILQLISCIIHFPVFASQVYLNKLGYFFDVHCDLYVTFIAIIHVGHFIQCFISINRFIAIIFPHHYRSLCSRKTVTFSIIVSWLLGFGLTSLFYFHIGGKFTLGVTGGCEPFVTNPDVFMIITSFNSYLPISILGVLYFFIFIQMTLKGHVSKWQSVYDGEPQTLAVKQRQERRVVIARMLFVSFLWYFVCLLPIPMVLDIHPDLYRKNLHVALWLHFLSLLGHAANPVKQY